MSTIDPASVAVFASAQGYQDLELEFIERVAAGAERAVDAVRASVTESLFESEPAAFLEVLENLAPDEASL